MEARKLNEKESLELITRMMQNTKMNLEVGSGNSLIIWGVSTLIANVVVYALLHSTHSPMSFWGWILVPIIGKIWTKMASTNTPKVTTKIDRIVSTLWLNVSFITMLLPITFVVLSLQTKQGLILSTNQLMRIIPFAEMLVLSLCLVANAIIIDFKPLRIGGLVGAILSLTLLCDSIYVHTLMFGVWAIVAMIIPGIKLNEYIKSRIYA